MPTLLVVEDEPVLRASVVRGLSKLAGVEIVDAGTKAEARKLIAAMPPNMLISDLDLPDGSGVELLVDLERRGLRIPIIFASGFLRRFEIPARDDIILLEKPVTLATLRKLVTQHLGGPPEHASPFGLADYVQLAGLGRRSVHLVVCRDGVQVGEVVIRDGEAWHAHDPKGDGAAAFRRLVTAKDVTVEATHPTPTARTLSGSCEQLLLETMRLEDEQSRDDDAADLAWDDLTTRRRSSLPPPPAARAPSQPAEPTKSAGWVQRSFEELYERGVEALLDKRYDDAFVAFTEAAQLHHTPSLDVNLSRLRSMGYGR